MNAVSRYQTETALCRLRALRAVIASLCVVSGWDGDAEDYGDDDDDDETDSRQGKRTGTLLKRSNLLLFL